MQKSIFIIIILIFNLTFGQENEDPTELLLFNLKTELSKNNISDYFVLKCMTYGTFHVYNLKNPNHCKPKGTYFTMYAFWNDGKNNYVRKFDNCGAFNTLKLTHSNSTDFYKNNIEKIKNEEVERYRTKPDSIANGITYSGLSWASHTPQRYFWFYSDLSEFKKHFDKYNLTTKEKHKNINYEFNNKLEIVKLNDICEKIIYDLNKKELFSRD